MGQAQITPVRSSGSTGQAEDVEKLILCNFIWQGQTGQRPAAGGGNVITNNVDWPVDVWYLLLGS